MSRGLVLLVLGMMVCGAFAEADAVVKLTADSYDDEVSSGKVYFIKFFAPWCGHCKRLAPVWHDLAKEFDSNESVVIASVDCTQYRDVCTGAEVKGYPTLKVFHKGEEFKAYRGARDLEALKAFVEEAASELLTETTE